MTITAQKLLTELGKRSWSGFLEEDMDFASPNSTIAKAELNSALRYLINLEDFPFKSKEVDFFTIKNLSQYPSVNGQIVSIYNNENYQTLNFISDNSNLNKNSKGEPYGYWIDNENLESTLRLFPTPDKKYFYRIIYNQYKPILDSNGKEKFEFENATDFLNIPENLEYLFMDCLILRTMITKNKDQSDENYLPTIKEFNQTWNMFTKSAKPIKTTNRMVW